MNASTAIKAGLVQLALVAVLAILLAVLLPKSFFEDWGWISGPAALLLCAYGTSRLLGLPPLRTMAGVILAGIPALIAVVIGVHWLGTLIAVIGFAIWCGYGPEPRRS